MDKCIACGLCAQKCPKKVDDPYNVGISKRKAIYISYSQTVPLKYAIDDECLYLTKGKCQACVKFCPTGAINFEDKGASDLVVGAVILAPGYQAFNPSGLTAYGYGHIPDVVTGPRVRAPAHTPAVPIWATWCGPRTTPSPKRSPGSSASAPGTPPPTATATAPRCAACTSVKQALVTAEHLSGGGLNQTIFYMDLRATTRSSSATTRTPRRRGSRLSRAGPTLSSPGRTTSASRCPTSPKTAPWWRKTSTCWCCRWGWSPPKTPWPWPGKFGIELDHHNFVRTGSFTPVATNRDGVYVCGAFRSPKAIPRSVTEASAAAAEAGRALVQARGTLTQEKTYPPEREVSGEEPRIGVFVCSCGINIAGVVDVKAVSEYALGLPNVVAVGNNLFTCSTDTQEIIGQKIKKMGFNGIVDRGLHPPDPSAAVCRHLREAGLNAYLLEMANIRNQNSWVHQKNPRPPRQRPRTRSAWRWQRSPGILPWSGGR